MTDPPAMATCPHCRTNLEEVRVERGVCPQCGKSLAAHFDQTLAGDDAQHEQIIATLDSTPVEPSRAAEIGTDDGPLFEPTLEFDPRAPLDDAQMTQMWAPSISAEATPTTSLKMPTNLPTTSGRTTSISATNLVIQTRAFGGRRDPSAAAPSGAGLDYEVLDLLGEGGMGVVYAARQGSIDRTVAIKMLKGDAVHDDRLRGKFLVEAVVTGDLEHPNIVPIYDLGENEAGALFYSMKRVVGTPWDDVIKSKSLAENIEILMKVADAVAFAHSRGVVHRDLKPENIMLGGFGEVLVMDWGLALTEDNRATSGMGGTPAYMAPEMAGGPMRDVGACSDIYLLGAILYEIVTGLRPHTGKSVMDCVKGAADNVIQPTEKSGELVNIALKAMATKIADRYHTVGQLQAAIRDYQSHAESILLATRATEDLSEAERTADYQTYSRAMFAFQEAVALWPGNEQARSGIDEVKRKYAATALDKADYDLGASLLDRDNPQHEELCLKIDEARRERDARQHRLKTAKRVGVALVALIFFIVTSAAIWINYEKGVAEQARDKAVAAEQNERDAKDAAVAAEKSERLAKEAALAAEQKEKTAKEAALIARNDERIARMAAEKAEEEERIAKETAVAAEEEERKAKVAAIAAQEEERKAKEAEEEAAYLARIGLAVESIERNAFDKARDLLAECPERLRNWEWQRLNHLCSLHEQEFRHDEPLETVAYSPDGKRFASGGWDGKVRIWDIENPDMAKVVCEIPASSGYVFAVAFSPDGKQIAVGTNERGAEGGRGEYLKLWNAETGEPVATFGGRTVDESHSDAVVSVEFSRDGGKLLSASYDGTARLWDVATPASPLLTLKGHDDGKIVCSARFSPDGQRIVTASDDGRAIVWSVAKAKDTDKDRRLAEFREHTGPVYAAVFSPDGKHVVSGGQDGRLLVWDPATAKPYDLSTLTLERNNAPQPYEALLGHSGPVRAITFSPATVKSGDTQIDSRIVSASDDNTIRVWDATSHAHVKTLRGHGGPVHACCFSPDGTRVMSASYDARVKTWNVADYNEQLVLGGHRDAVFSAAYDRDGQRIVTASRDRTARVWDAATGTELLELHEGHEFLVSRAVFFPDGQRMLTSSVDDTVRVWDLARGAEVARLDKTGTAAAVALSHDARWILTGSEPIAAKTWAAKLWSRTGGTLQFSPLKQDVEVTTVAFSHDDRLILTGDNTGRCRLWDRAAADAPRWSVQNHTRPITAAVFTLDDTRVLTASTDNTVGQWDIAFGNEIAELRLKHPDAVTSIAATSDVRWLLTSCADGVARLWNVEGPVAQPNREWKIKDRLPTTVRPIASNGNLGAITSKVVKIVEPITAVALSSDGRIAATVDELIETVTTKQMIGGVEIVNTEKQRIGQTVRLWSLESKQTHDGDDAFPEEKTFAGPLGAPRPLIELSGADAAYWTATFSQDGRFLALPRAGDVELWNVRTGQKEGVFGSHGAVVGADFSPTGDRIVTGSWDTTARVWNSQTGLVELKLDRGHSDRVNSSRFSPDGDFILTASDDNTAKLWDARGAPAKVVATLAGHTAPVRSAVFSPDGTRVLTASDDHTARIWDAQSGTLLDLLTRHEQAVVSAAFSHDAANDLRVVTCSEDNTAQIWNVSNGAELSFTLQGHSSIVTSAAFSPDGQRVVTGSEDTTAKIWDADTGKEIITLEGHTAPITSVVFSPDGSQVLTASRDRTAIVWATTVGN
jgi:WD40 repeat protein/serine/threonine protein kinase